MLAPNGTPKSRALARLQLVGAAALALAGLGGGVIMLRDHPSVRSTAVLRQAVAQVDAASQTRVTATKALEAASARAEVVEQKARVAVSRADAARARAQVVGADDVQLLAPNGGAAVVWAPPPLIERLQLDSNAVMALGTLVQWKDTVIATQDQRLSADSLELLARANAFTALERVKAPRCGRRCGILLGVGGVLATAVAVAQVRRAFQ